MSVLDRVGRIGDVPVRLAKFRPAEGRYQRRLSPVSPSEGFIAGDQFQLNAVPDTQVWNINSWSGGEGNDLFLEDERDVYHRSDGVRPKPTGEGLILGALGELTKDSGGVNNFSEGFVFGYGNTGSDAVLWAGRNASTMHEWNATGLETWGPAITVSDILLGELFSVADTDSDQLFIVVIEQPSGLPKLYKAEAPGGFVAAPLPLASLAPVIVGSHGQLWALQYDDLFVIDQTTFAQTQKVDVSDIPRWAGEDHESKHRLTASDVGPFWVRRTNVGTGELWEFNVGDDAGAPIGTIPTSPVFPYSVGFFLGAHMVAYRAAYSHDRAGDAFLYVQKGDTRTVVPLRSTTGSTASKRVLIAGVIGSDVMLYFDGAVWAYNLDTGGIYMVGPKASAGEPRDAAVADGSVFLSGVGPVGIGVERIRLDRYVSSGTIESGRFDVRYPGLPKLLTEVTVMTEPLPAGTSVEVAVASDGGTFVALAGAHDVDNATSHTFVGSTPSTSIIGREFELKLTLNGTSTATPTVRSVAAVVTGAAHLEEWVMEIDCSDIDSVGGQAGWDVIDQLRGLAASQQVVTFTNPWEQRGVDGADQIPVRVLDVILPQGERRDAYATIRVRRTQMVIAT